jgi:hypothetical protein
MAAIYTILVLHARILLYTSYNIISLLLKKILKILVTITIVPLTIITIVPLTIVFICLFTGSPSVDLC